MAIRQPFPIYPKQASVPRTQTNRRVALPPPLGGWNSRDDPSNMQPTDAYDLINMIPRPGYLEMRGGYESHSTGVGSDDVDLVVEFNDGTNQQLITASGSEIYNSTAAGAATSLGSGFSNGNWDTDVMNGIMAFVNGADAPQKWNGSALSALTITGVTGSTLIGVNVFKGRSYFWADNARSFWYSDTNTLGGALTEFELGHVAKRGGKLLRMLSWTVDGGSGPDDFAAFFMDSGEVIIYQGDDPGTSTDWGLVGVYDVGTAVNKNTITKFGGAVAVITQNDLVLMPDVFAQPASPRTKLSTAISAAVDSFGSNSGWEVAHFPNQRLLVINVPTATSPDAFEQYVLDSSTLAACRFTDIPARTWGLFQNDIYFGSTDGKVYKFDSVENDNSSDIKVTVHQAWTTLGANENKQVTSVRPVFEVEDTLDFDVGVSYDFDVITCTQPSSTAAAGTPWGSAWGSSWGTNMQIQKQWKLVSGNGSHLSVCLKFARQGDKPRWYRTDMLVKRGGNLF